MIYDVTPCGSGGLVIGGSWVRSPIPCTDFKFVICSMDPFKSNLCVYCI